MILAILLVSTVLGQATSTQATPAQATPAPTTPAPTQVAPKVAPGASGTSGKTAKGKAIAPAPVLPPPFGVSNVVDLLSAKVSEGIIIDMIRKQNIKISLSTQDLLTLTKAGASDKIIHELDPSFSVAAQDPVPVPVPVVVVHEGRRSR